MTTPSNFRELENVCTQNLYIYCYNDVYWTTADDVESDVNFKNLLNIFLLIPKTTKSGQVEESWHHVLSSLNLEQIASTDS